MSWGRGWALDDGQPLVWPGLCLQANGNVFYILLKVFLLKDILHRIQLFVLGFGFRLYRERWRRRLLLLLLHLPALLLHPHQQPLNLTVVGTQLDGLVEVLQGC